MFTTSHLGGIGGGIVFSGIGPDQYRQRAIAFGIITLRQIKITGEVNTIRSFVFDLFLGNTFQLGIRIFEKGELLVCNPALQVFEPVIGHFIFCFPACDQHEVLRIHHFIDQFKTSRLAAPDSISFPGCQFIRHQERKVATW